MKMTKRLLSLLLCLTLVTSIMTNLGAGLFSASAVTTVTGSSAGNREVPQVGIVVPEVIYLKPGTNQFGLFMGGGVTPGKNSTAEGTVTFQLANNVYVDAGTSIEVSYTGAIVSLTEVSRNRNKLQLSITGGTASSSTTDTVITWEFSYTVAGVPYTSTAYTYVYVSWLGQAGAQKAAKVSGIMWNKDNGVNVYGFITGIHSASGGNAKSNFVDNTPKKSGNLRTSAPLYAHYALNEWSGQSGYIPDGGISGQGGDSNGLNGIHPEEKGYFPRVSGGGVQVGGYTSHGDSDANDTVSGATGTITIDGSRHDNFSQIPYLSAGVMQFYYVQCNEAVEVSGISSTDGAISITESSGTQKHDAYGYGLYHMSGSLPSDDRTYVIQATERYRNTWASSSHIYMQTNLQVKIVNKQALRETVNTWVNKGFQADDYTQAKWTEYSNALRTAASVLGNPRANATQIANANKNLKDVGATLASGRQKLTYTITHMLKGVAGQKMNVNGTEYTVPNDGYVKIVESDTFYSGANIHAEVNQYVGFNPPDAPYNVYDFYNCISDVNAQFIYTSAKYTVTYIYDPESVGHAPFITGANISNPTFQATYGSKYGTLTEPKIRGWRFDGWYLNYDSSTKTYSNPVNASTVVAINGEHNLYAKWTCRFGGGHGSSTDPYLIGNYQHLQNINNTAYIPDTTGVYFKQTAQNIDYTSTYTLVENFKGSYDGDNNTITINGGIGGSDYAGFFGTISNGAEVKNLKVNMGGNFMANNGANVGFISEVIDSTVKNVHINCTASFVGSNLNVGAVAGNVKSTTATGAKIQNCSVTCSNNIRLYGTKENTITNYNNWVLVTKLPSDTTFDCGCNIMYVKANDFVMNGSAVISTTDLGAVQFTATPISGWSVEYRDGSGDIISNKTYYVPDTNLTNARYYIYFVKDVTIAARNTNTNSSKTGGTVSPTTARLEQGESVALTATPDTGYSFAGWSIQGNSGLINNATSATNASFTMGEEAVWVWADFSPNNYTVSFYLNEADDEDPYQVINTEYDETITIPTPPTRVGWTFHNWSTGKTGTSGQNFDPNDQVSNLATTEGANVKIYAIWTHDTFDINFVANGGTNLDYALLSNQVHGSTFTFPNITRVGYTFYGWFDNVDYEGVGREIGDTQTVTGPATYYAKWVQNVYIVAFNANGGTNSPESIRATYGVEFSIPTQTPTRTGYTFQGWDIVPAGATVTYTAGQEHIKNLLEGNDPNGGQIPTYTLYACWIANTYNATWLANGGTNPDTQYTILTYGQPFALYMPNQEPSRNGFSFNGWFTEATGGEQIKGSTIVEVTGDAVFYAQWTQKTYTIRFDKNSVDAYVDDPADEMQDVVVNFGSNYEMPDCNYVRDGYRFTGWSLTSTGTVAYDPGELYVDIATNDGEIVTLFAQWTPRRYNITFNGNGATAGSTQAQQVYFGDTVTLNPNGFIKSGSIFAGWATSLEQAQNGQYTYGDQAPFTMRSNGVVLYAVWAANQYKIVFHGNGATGGAMGGQLMAYGASEPLFKNAFTRNGYHFSGWSEAENSTSVSYSDEAVYTMLSESNKDLYAVWERNSYTLSFDGNAPDAENVASPITLYYDVDFSLVLTSGASQTIPAPSRPGYNFMGWSPIQGVVAVYEVNNSYTIRNLTGEENGNVTFYAIWEPCQVPVMWDCYGGTINGQLYVTTYPIFGQYIVFPSSVPSKQGYVFNNWWDEPQFNPGEDNGNQIMGDMVVDFAEEMTFYAHWSASAYTVVYNKNADDATGETAPTEHICDVARTLATCGFVRPGYRFVKWNTMPDGSGADYYGNGIVKYKNLSYSNGAEVTLYAIWERQDVSFTVKYMGQNETRDDYTVELATQILQKQTDSLEYASAYSSRAFSGYTWNNNDYYVRVNGDGSTILYVYYNRNTYTVTYHSNDGYDDTYTQYFFHGIGQKLTPVSFRRSGYEFDHWASRADDSGTIYSNAQEDVMFSGNADLYAQWKHTSSPYTVYHYVQAVNGSFPESAKTVQNLEGTSLSTITAQPMEIDGFEWDETVPGTVSSGIIAVDGSLILKLYYVRQTYDLILDPNGGVGDEVTREVRFGETIRLPSVATLGYSLPGYAFSGWATTPTGDPIYIDNSSYQVVAGEQRLFARWQTGLYTITFDSNGGSTVTPMIAAYGAVISAPQPDPVKAGFVFRAWTLNGEDYEFTTMPRENFTLVASWEADSVTVTFDAGNATSGDVPAPITGQYGQSFEMPGADLIYDNEDNEVYRRLVGWSTTPDSDSGTLVGANTAFPSTSTTLYPVWSANYYELNQAVEKTQSDNLPASIIKDFDYSSSGRYANLGSPAGWYPRDYFTDASVEALELAAETAQLQRNSYFAQTNQENVDALVDDINTAYYDNLELKELSLDMDITCNVTPEGHKYPDCYGYHSFNELKTSAQKAMDSGYYQTATVTRLRQAVNAATTNISRLGTNPKYPHYRNFVTYVNNVVTAYHGLVLLKADFTAFENLYASIDRSEFYLYTQESIDNLDNYYAEKIQEKDVLTKPYQYVVDGYVQQLQAYIDALATRNADYSAIAVQFKRIPPGYTDADLANYSGWETFNEEYLRSIYTVESVERLRLAVININWSLSIADQDLVSGAEGSYEYQIRDAIDSLAYLSTSYTVNHYVQNANDDLYVLDDTAVIQSNDGTVVTATEKTIPGFHLNVDDSTVSGTVSSVNPLVLNLYYDRNNYTITFETNGGSEIDPLVARYGSAITAPTDPVKLGSVFSGWYSDPNFENAFTFSTMPLNGNTLYAKWTESIFDINFMLNDGTDTVYRTVEFNEGFNTSAPAQDPVRAGYTFGGWYDNAECTGDPHVFGVMGNADIAVYAKWTPRNDTPYSIVHNVETINGGFAVHSTEDYAGTTGETVTATPLTGLTGFELDEDASTLSTAIAGTGDTVLNLYYVRTTYTITFNTNGGSEISEQSNKYGTVISAPTNPTKRGYVFGGWKRNGSVFIFSTMPAENIVLDATWTPATNTPYTIKRYTQDTDLLGYTEYSSDVLTGTTEASVTANMPGIPGFTLDETMGTRSGTVSPNGDLVLSLYYTRNSYTISFNSNGGSNVASITQLYGTVVAAPENPQYPGFTFVKWQTALGEDYTFTTMPAENIVLTAVWATSDNTPYTVEYYKENLDGTFTKVETVTLSGKTNTTISAEPRTYEGFELDEDASVTSGLILPDGSLVLVMSYVRSQYTISFNSDGGSQVAPITAKYGAAVSAPENPTKRGYIFNGWQTSGGSSYSFTTMPAENLTLTATWSLDPNTPYAVKYYWENVNSSSYTLHETVELSGEPGQSVSAEIKTYQGFTYDSYSSTVTGSIAGDGSLILSVYYTRNYYTIAFIIEEYGFHETYSYAFGANVVPEEDPEPPYGLVFSGWQNVPETMPAENVNVYGTFDPITYKITYLVDGEVFAEESYAPETEISPLENTPTKLGYQFVGWDGLPDYMEYEDIEVTAEFIPIEYTLTYTAEGAIFTTQTYYYGDTVAAPENKPAKTGHTFIRWNDLPETMPAENVTVTAAFAINTYKVYYVVDGEAYGDPQSVAYGAAVTAIAAPSRTGYTFSGWQNVPETMPASDVTITGSFTAIDYTITYYIDGTYFDEQTWHYEDTVTALEAPARTGYEFSGWQNLPETMPAENVTATGVYTIKSFKVFYVVDGEAYGEQTYEYNTQIRPMAVPAEREGYTFSGWSAIPEVMPAENITVTGTFTPKQYKVTFTVDGENYDEAMVAYGAEITLPAAPTKTGYEFVGWKNIPATMPASDITLEAEFTVKAFTITYKVDGVDYDTQSCNFGAAVIAIAEPSARIGYTFSGWQNVPERMPAEDITVTGTFTPNTYTVTFMNGEEVYDVIEAAYDSEPSTPQENPTKVGYEFRGWIGLPERMPANNITVTADYIINAYRVYYYVGSELFKTQIYNYGSEITPAEYPEEREGYTFSGWSDIPATMPANDLTVSGNFALNIYRVTYYLDGEIYNTYTKTFGAELEQLPDPEARDGYTFSGWTDLPATMPAHDVDISGSFLANTYQIFYILDGEPYKASSYKFGDEVTAIDAPPEKTGYTFGGWQGVPETMPAENVNVYGVYNVNSYNLNFYIDGEYDSSIPVNYGADIEITYVPTKEGHEFNGWTGVPETMPAEEVNVYGTFSALSYKVTYMSEGEYYGEEMFVFDSYVTPEIEEPTKTGYRFQSWVGLPEKMPAEDVTVTALFIINTYNVTYFVDGTQYGEADEYEYQADITLRAEPEARKGYTFTGWSAEGLSEIPTKMPDHDIQIVGSYIQNTYTVTYYVDSEYYTAQPYKYGDTITPANAPEREGYTFSGWSEIPETMPDESIEVTGSMIPREYNITYMIDGEVYRVVPCTYTHQIEAIEGPAKEGYTFDGWTGLPNVMPSHDIEVSGSYTIAKFKVIYYVDNEKYAEDEFEFMSNITPRPALSNKPGFLFSGWSDIPETMPSYDVEVFGEYIADSFKLTYIMNDETYAEQVYASGETVVPPTAPTAPAGYVFAGWEGLPAAMPAKNVTVTGSFKKGTFKITYYVDGEIYADETYEYQQAVTPLPVPGSRTGFDFSGWTEIPETMPGNNVSIYGNYLPKTYEINYYIDGVKVGTTFHAYGSTVSPLADQTRTGHTFNGWVGVPETMPAENVNVTGSFTINQYTITYMVDGEQYDTQTYDYNALIQAPTAPTKPGSTFSGWIDLPTNMPAEDIVISGSFEKNKALVSFSLNGGTGTVPASIYDTVGTAITLPAQGDIANGSREFLGWATSRDAGESDVLTTFEIPENGAVLYAVWSVVQIELIAREGSNTYIDENNGIIFGVEANLTEAQLLNNYIDVTGDGTIEVYASARRMGTGTVITLCDANGNELKSYYLVVFGDVDGNGIINQSDIAAANEGLVDGFEMDCYKTAANVIITRKNDRFTAQDVAELLTMIQETGVDQAEIADTLAYYSDLL